MFIKLLSTLYLTNRWPELEAYNTVNESYSVATVGSKVADFASHHCAI